MPRRDPSGRRLRWHYRSRHESLIAFANKDYYADQLITFPSAERSSATRPERVPTPVKLRGPGERAEARAVVGAAAEVARRRPDLSVAIVAVNQTQRELIEELLAAEEAAEPALAAYRERWEHGLEPLIVKNSRTSRATSATWCSCPWSTARTPRARCTSASARSQAGTAIAGLNVLFTRARRKLAVFSSLRPDDILVGPDKKPGVRILREYLRYAATGQLHEGSGGRDGYDSDFEGWVGSALGDAGHKVEAQVGGGRVPDRPRGVPPGPAVALPAGH